MLSFHPGEPLSFISGLFVFLFLLFLLFYPLAWRTSKRRVIALLLFSLYFYYKIGGLFVVLLIVSTLVDFWLGQRIGRQAELRSRRISLWAGIAANIAVLVFFKYSHLWTGFLNILKSSRPDIGALIVPVGISFYTFQKISYLVDVYRRKTPPAARAADLLLYVAFFPRVIAGPIVRANEFFPQLSQAPKYDRQDLGEALFLILTGLFKKAVIADYIGINFVNRVFVSPGLYSGLENLLAVYGYAIQIYCDFSGYTDIALGIGRLLGLRLPANFRSPYRATSITDFWRRWHITLSTWLRDYLFLPLAYGLSRRIKADRWLRIKSEIWIYASAAFLTWLVCGLWHGASWGFIVWGLLHGCAITIEKILKIPQKVSTTGLRRFGGRVASFHYVCLTWIFFRAENLGSARLILKQIFFFFKVRLFPQFVSGYPLVFSLIVLGFVLHYFPDRGKNFLRRAVDRMPLPVKSLVLAAMIWLVIQVRSSAIQPFIYFKF